MSAVAHFRPLELRIAAEYRRCAVYVAFGWIIYSAIVIWQKLEGFFNKPWEETIAIVCLLAAIVLRPVAFIFRYRLWSDVPGIWRRRLFRRDLWPWEAFEQGLVRPSLDQQRSPSKSWYWRTIALSYLGKLDRAAYDAAIGRFWKPPPPPPLPKVAAVKYGFRARLELTADGVRLMAHRHDLGALIPRRQVIKAEIFRSCRARSDFQILLLHLPGLPKPVRLFQSQGRPARSGADAELIAAFLQRYLGDGQFVLIVLAEPPADDAEADRRLAHAIKSEKELRLLNGLCWCGFAACFIIAIASEPKNLANGKAVEEVR